MSCTVLHVRTTYYYYVLGVHVVHRSIYESYVYHCVCVWYTRVCTCVHVHTSTYNILHEASHTYMYMLYVMYLCMYVWPHVMYVCMYVCMYHMTYMFMYVMYVM